MVYIEFAQKILTVRYFSATGELGSLLQKVPYQQHVAKASSIPSDWHVLQRSQNSTQFSQQEKKCYSTPDNNQAFGKVQSDPLSSLQKMTVSVPSREEKIMDDNGSPAPELSPITADVNSDSCSSQSSPPVLENESKTVNKHEASPQKLSAVSSKKAHISTNGSEAINKQNKSQEDSAEPRTRSQLSVTKLTQDLGKGEEGKRLSTSRDERQKSEQVSEQRHYEGQHQKLAPGKKSRPSERTVSQSPDKQDQMKVTGRDSRSRVVSDLRSTQGDKEMLKPVCDSRHLQEQVTRVNQDARPLSSTSLKQQKPKYVYSPNVAPGGIKQATSSSRNSSVSRLIQRSSNVDELGKVTLQVVANKDNTQKLPVTDKVDCPESAETDSTNIPGEGTDISNEQRNKVSTESAEHEHSRRTARYKATWSYRSPLDNNAKDAKSKPQYHASKATKVPEQKLSPKSKGDSNVSVKERQTIAMQEILAAAKTLEETNQEVARTVQKEQRIRSARKTMPSQASSNLASKVAIQSMLHDLRKEAKERKEAAAATSQKPTEGKPLLNFHAEGQACTFPDTEQQEITLSGVKVEVRNANDAKKAKKLSKTVLLTLPVQSGIVKVITPDVKVSSTAEKLTTSSSASHQQTGTSDAVNKTLEEKLRGLPESVKNEIQKMTAKSSAVLKPKSLVQKKTFIKPKVARAVVKRKLASKSSSESENETTKKVRKKVLVKKKQSQLKKTKRKIRKKKTKVFIMESDNEEKKMAAKFQNRVKKLAKTNKDFSGPFIRLSGPKGNPVSCSVVNMMENDVDKASRKRKSGQYSRDLLAPSSDLSTKDWVCSLCGKKSNDLQLGDLFGPYYIEKMSDEPSGRRRKRSDLDRTREKDMDEVWAHENCIIWTHGIYVISDTVCGLRDSILEAKSMVRNTMA